MRSLALVCVAFAMACNAKPKNKPPADEPDPPAPVRTPDPYEVVAASLPDLGAYPLPRELGEDPVYILETGVHDGDPTSAPLVALADGRLPGTEAVVADLLPAFDRRSSRQRVKPFHADLFVDADTPYATFARVLATAKDAGFGRFHLGVRNHEGVRRMPLILPEPDQSPELIVSLTTDALRLFSASGAHGTADDPALALAAGEYSTLASGVDRILRSSDGSKLVALRPAPDVPYRAVVLAIAALRPAVDNVALALPE